MHTNTNRLATDLALPDTNTTSLDYLETPRTLLGTWIWNSDPSKHSDKRLVLRWRLDLGREHRAIEELSHMSNHELVDIGLSRSDLTVEGLAIAGAKRARRQGLISTELAELADKHKASGHGN